LVTNSTLTADLVTRSLSSVPLLKINNIAFSSLLCATRRHGTKKSCSALESVRSSLCSPISAVLTEENPSCTVTRSELEEICPFVHSNLWNQFTFSSKKSATVKHRGLDCLRFRGLRGALRCEHSLMIAGEPNRRSVANMRALCSGRIAPGVLPHRELREHDLEVERAHHGYRIRESWDEICCARFILL